MAVPSFNSFSAIHLLFIQTCYDLINRGPSLKFPFTFFLSFLGST